MVKFSNARDVAEFKITPRVRKISLYLIFEIDRDFLARTMAVFHLSRAERPPHPMGQTDGAESI